MPVPGGARRRALLLFVLTGCVSSGGGGSCGELGSNGGLGLGYFGYQCPESGDPDTPNPDAYCATAASTDVPAVAVGAPFQLTFDQASDGPPQPADPSLATQSTLGWSISEAGWLSFIAWSGSDVVDFTHVRANAIASLRWGEDFDGGALRVGSDAEPIGVIPLDADGGVLGGRIACSFAGSDPTLLSVTSTGGRVAEIAGLAPGSAILTASCGGAELAINLTFVPARQVPDAADDGTLTEAGDGATDGEPTGDAGDGADAGASGDVGTSASDAGGE
jgi:hypothetical protein